MAPVKNCQNGQIMEFILSSPVGDLLLSCCSKAIHSLGMLHVQSDKEFQPNQSTDVTIKSPVNKDPLNTCNESYDVAAKCVQWLHSYFHGSKGDIHTVELPSICHLMETSDSFTNRVWKTLAEEVGFGQTVTYAELASMSGSSSTASRAVGQAMRNNPVMIIVPCHRVILSSGKIGNYSGGRWNDVKAWLLEHEKS